MVSALRDIPNERLAEFCRKWGLRELAIFGSMLRDDFGPDSDVDILFTMLPGRSYGFLEYFDMKDELEALFGRPVDLVARNLVEESPNWIRKRHILSTCRTIYAA